MRTLTFPPADLRYRLLHESTLSARIQLTPQQFRTVAKLQDKLEAIGTPLSDAPLPEGVVAFYECKEGGVVALENAEHAMLKQMLEATAFVPARARHAVAVYDFLDAAPEG